MALPIPTKNAALALVAALQDYDAHGPRTNPQRCAEPHRPRDRAEAGDALAFAAEQLLAELTNHVPEPRGVVR
jgi:hypothetical protein